MVIKGTADGLVVEPGVVEWQAFIASLRTRLAETGQFFRGGLVTLRAAARPVTVEQLQALSAELADYGLVLTAVETNEPETRRAADSVGLKAASLPVQIRPVALPGATDVLAPIHDTARNGNGKVRAEETRGSIVVRRTLRSGQSVEYDGHVVILGDVNPGAEVVASGDVLVWGKLRGMVHAGATGDVTARVFALQLTPTQLRIGKYIARPPEEDKQRAAGGPETARVVDEQIVVEAWSKG